MIKSNSTVQHSAFSISKLRKSNLSVARKQYTPPSELQTFVVDPILARTGEVFGFARALVKEIRHISYRSIDDVKLGKAFCVVDHVEPSDHDGHATIGFSDVEKSVKDNDKRKYRPFAVADLVEKFSSLLDITSVYR